MINEVFAKQFIRRIRSQTDYNINIMNEHGIIIASCNEERVGTFHATAFTSPRISRRICRASRPPASISCSGKIWPP